MRTGELRAGSSGVGWVVCAGLGSGFLGGLGADEGMDAVFGLGSGGDVVAGGVDGAVCCWARRGALVSEQ